MRGAHAVLEECKELIRELGLEDRILLKAGFCQGRCTEGVNLVFVGEPIGGVRPGEVRTVFDWVILPKIRGGNPDGTHRTVGGQL